MGQKRSLPAMNREGVTSTPKSVTKEAEEQWITFFCPISPNFSQSWSKGEERLGTNPVPLQGETEARVTEKCSGHHSKFGSQVSSLCSFGYEVNIPTPFTPLTYLFYSAADRAEPSRHSCVRSHSVCVHVLWDAQGISMVGLEHFGRRQGW